MVEIPTGGLILLGLFGMVWVIFLSIKKEPKGNNVDKDTERENKEFIQDALVAAIIITVIMVGMSGMLVFASWESFTEAWSAKFIAKGIAL